MLASIPGREEERKRGEEERRRGGRRILGMEEEKIGKTLIRIFHLYDIFVDYMQ